MRNTQRIINRLVISHSNDAYDFFITIIKISSNKLIHSFRKSCSLLNLSEQPYLQKAYVSP